MSNKLKSLPLPSLRAMMGDWIYYISFMKMGDIAKRVMYAQEIHKSESLNNLLQRKIDERRTDIAKYLQEQEQRFFNTIIIGVHGGAPNWYELGISKNEFFDPNNYSKEIKNIEGGIGVLILRGDEKLFAIDGQHRVAGIRAAVKQKEALKDDEVSVIFVSAKRDEKSRARTRRLFSTLNRYAKPVSTRDIIALDEDDVIAIITRRMLDDYKLFRGGRINTTAKTKGIPKNDHECITTIVALYDSLNIYLCDKKAKEWNEFLKIRPNEEVIDQYYEKAITYWNKIKNYFEDIKLVSKNEKAVLELRHENGGHLIFRPIGLTILSEVVKLLKDDITLNTALRRIAKASLELSEKPWKGLLWESLKKRMITRKENQKVAIQLIYYMSGGDLAKLDLNEEKLKENYASAINWDLEESGDLPLPLKVA